MEKLKTCLLYSVLTLFVQVTYCQTNDLSSFAFKGKKTNEIRINELFSANAEIFPFNNETESIFGLSLNAVVELKGSESLVRVILSDKHENEYMVYEVYPMLIPGSTVSINDLCEETGILNAVSPHSLKIEVNDAVLHLNYITVATVFDKSLNLSGLNQERKKLQNNYKIKKLNEYLINNGISWTAGNTQISELSFDERRKLYGESKFPSGFEFYTGGIIQAGSQLKSAACSEITDSWDWRDRHGKNWISPVRNQGSGASCWAFAAVGATEAQANIFFNQLLNPDLSEQDVISCSGGGTVSGGYPSTALDYIMNKGIVDEAAFPYTATDQPCTAKSASPSQVIKIGGRVDFGSGSWSKTEDNLKKMIIKYGPLSSGILDWSHAMTLVGWKVIRQGDSFYSRDLNKATGWITIPAGSPLIGTTVWIFKNSWGDWGDGGYVYVQTSMPNIGWTHAIMDPVQSLKQNYTVKFADSDGDGYYWWGLGSKPAGCPGPDTPDGNDNNSALGPLDEFGNCLPIYSVPTANFKSDQTSVIQGGTISFTDLSLKTPTSWNWKFAGGIPAISTLQNPVIAYSTPGTYDVILTVTNPAGSGSVTKIAFITVNPPAPVAGFIADKTSVVQGGSISFTDQSVNIPLSWNWKFAGGNPSVSNLRNPVVTYTAPGKYDVILTAANISGSGTITRTAYITVDPPAPVAGFISDKVSVVQGGNITYTDQSTNSPTAWNWQFTGGTPSSSTTQNPVVTYKTPGTYSVSLTSANKTGSGTLTKTSYITVTPPAPIANFTSDRAKIIQGGSVTFTDQSGNAPTSWFWQFSGGTPETSTSRNPVITYNVPGVYNVILISSNISGSSTVTQSNYIIVNPPSPVVDFTSDKVIVIKGESVLFSDISLNSPTSLIWQFNGGTPSSSTLKNPVVKFNTTGTFSVTLTASNASGLGTLTKTGYITVNPPAPEARFTSDKSSTLQGGSIAFTDQSLNLPASWNWQFNGGTPASSSDSNPVIVYNTAGTYSVTLIVTNASGSNTIMRTGYVTVNKPAPKADFSSDKTIIARGESILFTDESLNDPSSWKWQFNGGTPSTSTMQNPVIVYDAPGIYQVTLCCSNDGGSNTVIKSGYIKVDSVLYCKSSGTDHTNDWIREVKINNFTKISGSSSYSDFTDFKFPVTPGESFGIILTAEKKPPSQVYWSVFIDINRNGDFTDPGEKVFGTSNTNDVVTGIISIPSKIILPTRLRVSLKRDSQSTPCEVFAFGEVEDYTISEQNAGFFQTGIREINNPGTEQGIGILVYPNPAEEFVNLQLTNFKGKGNLIIINSEGQQVYNRLIGSTVSKIDVSQFASGLYFILVESGNQLCKSKFIKR